MNTHAITQTPVSLAQMKEEIEKIKQRDTTLGFRAAKTEEYLSYFSLDAKKAEELTKKIEALEIPRLKVEHVMKIVDLCPTTVEELKLILQAYTLTITQDNVKRIQAILDEYGK